MSLNIPYPKSASLQPSVYRPCNASTPVIILISVFSKFVFFATRPCDPTFLYSRLDLRLVQTVYFRNSM